MKANFPVVLDACVIANYTVCNLLLRLAEQPRLHSLRWSKRILDEAENAQTARFKKPWSPGQAARYRSAIETAFPEALTPENKELEKALTNQEKDRHVLATAIISRSEIIVTCNLKDFPHESLQSWGVKAVHPAEYLMDLYTIDSGIVVSRLTEIATQAKITPSELMNKLAVHVPAFAAHVAQALGWLDED